MKLSIRKKIILTFLLFFSIGGLFWLLNFYNHQVLNKKLQIIEKKGDLFNAVLEARRYEKNFFLYFDYESLEDAIAYVRQGETKLSSILEEYGGYLLAKDLDQELKRLQEYKQSLADMMKYYRDRSLHADGRLIDMFSKHQENVRDLGSRITRNMENMLASERRYVKQLVRTSRIYHFIALGGLLAISVLTGFFLVINVNRPLKSIEDAIHKISQGDYADIPALSTGDEFESLVANLNRMIGELNRRSEQLIHAKKLASLGTLTSGVAHELNNPLNNISTSLQILSEELEDGDPDYNRELLAQAEHEIERARDIVRALLEFSRERSFSLKSVHFKTLVEETIKLIRSEVPSHVEIHVDIPEDIRGRLDPQRMQQVLINLIQNGIQAMGDTGVLDIRARKSQNGFWFEIQDTGKGIPQEVLSKIFDPFFTTKDVGKGTGLGLSVTHGIVEQHGGRIEVESRMESGTTFSIFLPEDPSPPFQRTDEHRA